MRPATRFASFLALGLAVLTGCQEPRSATTGPEAPGARAHHRPGHGGGGDDGGDGDGGGGGGSTVELTGGYTTLAAQPVDYSRSKRGAGAMSADDEPITYAVDGLTTTFDAASCDWSDNLDAAGAAAFWSEAALRFAAPDARVFATHVDTRANGQRAGEHHTRGRFFEDGPDGRLMWRFKVGVPENLLESLATREAIGTFTENGATAEFEITSGALLFRKIVCGPGAGCTGTDHTTVACPNADTFTATVTP